MKITELTKWQWQGYAKYHACTRNLLIHIVAVPVFIFGVITLLLALAHLDFVRCAMAVLLMAASLAAQAFGHAKEVVPGVPFKGKLDVFYRLFIEPLFTFPKFVLRGGWYLALHDSLQK
jgi:uncharacterized membrane protein YGL010W